jgi:PAS domain S-box-containing protein
MDGYRLILELIARGEPLSVVMNTLTGTIEQQLGDDAVASILLLEGDCLRYANASVLPREFVDAVDGVRIGPAVGSCGTAVYRRQPVIVSDIAVDPLWEQFREVSLACGLRACWSIPIFSGNGGILGTFAIYYRQPRKPEAGQLELVQTMARAAAIAIERDQAGRALRDSEQRLRATFEHAAVGMAHVALDGRWIRVNQRLCDIVGYDRDELMRLTFQDITHPEDLESDLAQVRRVVAGEIHTYSMEKRYIRKDGALIWINLTVSLVRDVRNEPQYFIAVIENISQRKQAEQQLSQRARQQQQLYQLAVAVNRAVTPAEIHEAALNAIQKSLNADRASILLFDENGIMQFTAWRSLSDSYRQAVAGHTPWSPETINPQPLCVEDVRTASLEPGLRQTILAEGIGAMSFIPLVYQARLLGKFMVYHNTAHRFTDDEVQFSQNIATQLASAIERKRSEQALRQAKEQAEAANEAKDRFLAVLSHELRTPLTPVVMTVAALEEHPDLPPELRDDLAMIRRNIDLETKLIDDLLDLGRVANGKLRLQTELVPLHVLLEHVLDSCAAEARDRGLTIECELSATGDQVIGDPARLQQVFWNLLKNALKFTPSGGRIFVRSGDGAADSIKVEIQDTGVGVAPDVLPRLFNAFEQGGAGVSRSFGGLGLGLAIARAVVELHGGTIRAASAGEGHGTTFTIELKRAPAPAAGTPATDLPLRLFEPMSTRILLVEDHADSARTLARLLGRAGYIVKTAASVASALQLIASEPFDILISDIGLPDATGYDLMKQVRQQYHIQGIALSGFGMEHDMQRSRDAGFADHVVKPVNVAQLEALIRRIAAGSLHDDQLPDVQPPARINPRPPQ